jgi:hypothetical protein
MITCIDQAAKAAGNLHEVPYKELMLRVQRRFQRNIKDSPSLFTTDVDLWPVYIGSFPAHERQAHNCHACRQFLRNYGGLVTIDARGAVQSAIWDGEDENEEYHGVFAAMAHAVRRAKVTGVHLSNVSVWGAAVTGNWTHMHLAAPTSILHTSRAKTPYQAMAEKREDHHNVMRALAEFPLECVTQALTVLQTDTLYRSEKVLGPVQWLSDLHAAAGNRSNAVWRAVATAPAGFCHPRSSMAGTLLEDLAAGLPFQEVKRRFDAKMHPLQYQRPQVAPSDGQIAAAEKLVADLGIAASLRRRYARIEECQLLWAPRAKVDEVTEGVFGHLKQKQGPKGLDLPVQRITWAKFSSTVLPGATSLELSVSPYARVNFSAMVTAADLDAPPILQWDDPGARNPVSWYLYNGGSAPQQWGVSYPWAKVVGVSLKPHMWTSDKYKHQGVGAMLIVEGARDSAWQRAGGALFPEILKSELHPARAVIEKYSKGATIAGYDQSTACGLFLDGKHDTTVRVTDGSGNRLLYTIDRWD